MYELVIAEAHERIHHRGRDSVLNELRKKLWVDGAKTAVNKVIRKCVECKKVNARKLEKVIANLRAERIAAD